MVFVPLVVGNLNLLKPDFILTWNDHFPAFFFFFLNDFKLSFNCSVIGHCSPFPPPHPHPPVLVECQARARERAAVKDAEKPRSQRVPRCCSESGRRILGLFVPACHSVPLWSFAAHVVSHMGSWARTRREGGIAHKPQFVSSPQIKHCCLWKKNEFQIRCYICAGQKRSSIHRQQGVLLPW